MSYYKFKKLIVGNGTSIENKIMHVEDGKILEFLDSYDGDMIQADYIMPGLIDCHTHICFPPVADMMGAMEKMNDTDIVMHAVKNLEDILKGGVTYIRDVGGVNNIQLHLKKYLKDGSIKGPDMLCAGKIVTMTGGHGWTVGRECDGPDEVRKAVREQLKAGADLIKVISSGGVLTPGVDVNAYQFNVDELIAAREEAHKAGRKICTHCHSMQGVKNSILAGIDSVEHATILDQEAVDMAIDAGTYFVPTLSAVHFIIKHGEEGGIPKYAVDKSKSVFKKHQASFKLSYKSGVKIAMGTDVGTPFNKHASSSAFELELMVKAGMTEMDAILSATKNAAMLLGVDHTHGTLEAGKVADFLVLEEDPIKNIKTIQSPSVYKNGLKI
ncbi:amidohydrolase family protein [Acidaminobacter sp. JC074]|uniref:metal-dependent hydrolase family protein n=1 Tax=Acidaminobacter sp. JC074 TaxID=2530199 RepID=UPI001F0E0C27|nr:amidohydrolase family protein [Acidaminobacter sp. JC074]MCH4888511.1 amidohydrolase family protein [Acidaminobacter sp. JC074]